MKYLFISMVLFFSFSVSGNKSHAQDDFPVLEGPYFGQKPPGLIAEIFTPGIVSMNGRYEYGISFSPDSNDMYFSVQEEDQPASIYYSIIEGKKWQPIRRANFTQGKKAGEMEPFVSHDGTQIYFTAYNTDFTDTKIWAVNRVKSDWGNATKLESPINNEEVFNPVLAKNGDLFYIDIFKSKTYHAAFKNGGYPEVQAVEIEFGVHGFISPTQDYLLVDAQNQEDVKRTDNDIYIYFKQKDGTWSEPINLGSAVNSSFDETVPSVTPDGQYLFFSRYDEAGGLSNFYWVSTKVIENFRSEHEAL